MVGGLFELENIYERGRKYRNTNFIHGHHFPTSFFISGYIDTKIEVRMLLLFPTNNIMNGVIYLWSYCILVKR